LDILPVNADFVFYFSLTIIGKVFNLFQKDILKQESCVTKINILLCWM